MLLLSTLAATTTTSSFCVFYFDYFYANVHRGWQNAWASATWSTAFSNNTQAIDYGYGNFSTKIGERNIISPPTTTRSSFCSVMSYGSWIRVMGLALGRANFMVQSFSLPLTLFWSFVLLSLLLFVINCSCAARRGTMLTREAFASVASAWMRLRRPELGNPITNTHTFPHKLVRVGCAREEQFTLLSNWLSIRHKWRDEFAERSENAASAKTKRLHSDYLSEFQYAEWIASATSESWLTIAGADTKSTLVRTNKSNTLRPLPAYLCDCYIIRSSRVHGIHWTANRASSVIK